MNSTCQSTRKNIKNSLPVRYRAPIKARTSIVWCKAATPKNDFLMLIVNMYRWPSRDHILLRCADSEQIWELVVLRRMCYRSLGLMLWTVLMDWLWLRDATTSCLGLWKQNIFLLIFECFFLYLDWRILELLVKHLQVTEGKVYPRFPSERTCTHIGHTKKPTHE